MNSEIATLNPAIKGHMEDRFALVRKEKGLGHCYLVEKCSHMSIGRVLQILEKEGWRDVDRLTG